MVPSVLPSFRPSVHLHPFGRIGAWHLTTSRAWCSSWGLASIVLAAAAVGDWYVRRKLERWARIHGIRLLEFSGAPFWRGPRAWRRMDDQEDYRVVVEDAAGRRRSGWLLFTARWRGLGPQEVEIRWDESA